MTIHLTPFTIIGGLALLASCVGYRPDPVDLGRDTAAWKQSSLGLCPPGTLLDAGKMRHIGLLLNPDLNQARLAYLNRQEATRYAGLWEDPSLSLEVERVLKENLTNPGVSAGFSLPVTGLPKLERRIASLYEEADYWNLREKERLYLAGLESLRDRLLIAQAKKKLMKERLVQLRDEHSRMERLYGMGEAEWSDCQFASQRLYDTEKAEQEQEKETLSLGQELVAQLGLHPAVGVVGVAGALPVGVPPLVAVPEPGQLAGNPGIKALLASYGATEEELRAEIRRQYPEISLSPGWSKEDEEKKVTLGVEFSLPVWNRNRAAIAQSSGERALKKHEAVQAWRKLLQDCSKRQAQQELARRHCLAENEHLAVLQAAADQQERLYKMGESSLPVLAEARHEMYQRRLSYLDCLAELLNVQAPLKYLL